MALYGIGFFVIAAVIAHFFATISGSSLFNLLSSFSKQETKKAFKFKKLPDEKQFILAYPSKNFKATINGRTISGKDPKTGVDMLRFHYGEDQMTDFTLPSDPSYFRIAEPSKLGDNSKLTIEVIDDDAYWKLKQKADNMLLYSKNLEKTIQDSMENDNSRLLKQIENIREKKKVAFGWTSSGQPSQGGLPYRPWSSFNRFGGGGYGGGQQNEEEQF